MALIGYLLRVSPSELASVRAAPESAWALLHDRLDRAREQEREIEERAEAAGDAWVDVDDPGEALGVVDLDRAWHGLCFLLHEHGVRRLLMDAAPIDGAGEVAAGAGPPRVTTPEQVREVAERVARMSDAVLLSEYDPEEFRREEIDPDIWDDGGEGEEYLAEYFAVLSRCFQAAARNGDAVVFYLR